MTLSSSQQQTVDTEFDCLNVSRDAAVTGRPVAKHEVGRVGQDALDHERELHIEDASWAYQIAYERFQLHGCPADREEALALLHARDAAILARSPAVQAQRHAAFERELDERFAFFNSDAALAMARGVAHA